MRYLHFKLRLGSSTTLNFSDSENLIRFWPRQEEGYNSLWQATSVLPYSPKKSSSLSFHTFFVPDKSLWIDGFAGWSLVLILFLDGDFQIPLALSSRSQKESHAQPSLTSAQSPGLWSSASPPPSLLPCQRGGSARELDL